ncbi:hypothetical protein CN890_19625 [Priestia megaterium]|nr:hypothetical protein CN890_19625 [Priestia megaterium]PGO37137.1 hypothetical protein CN973_19945 [Priestia megaterium]
MTGNLSRTVLRGAGARESACLPDVTVFKISFLVRLDSLHENEIIYDIKNIKENKNALLYILVIRLHSNLL